MKTFKSLSVLLAAIACCFVLTGCLSHWILDSETRLQVENATEDCSIIRVSVVSEDSSKTVSWITETLLPGERSHVVREDWVGEFLFRVDYTNSTDAEGDTLSEYKSIEIEGGSIYLKIKGDADSLEIVVK